jgi:hypothetical protein
LCGHCGSEHTFCEASHEAADKFLPKAKNSQHTAFLRKMASRADNFAPVFENLLPFFHFC